MLRSSAELAYDKLTGIACLFKPPDMQMTHFFAIIQERLASAFNQMSCRPAMQRVDIVRDRLTGKEMVISSVDLSDTVQALGPRYQAEDFDLQSIFPLETFSSGLQLISINDGSKRLEAIKDGQPLRCYHIRGKFGQSTDTLDANGVTVEKSTFKHVTRSKIERVCALIQSSFQATMYKMSGISPFMQAGFELAKAGLWKPRDHTLPPIVYGLKVLDFKPPFFDIEMHVLNEKEIHLKEVILDIGLRLRTSSLSESVRRAGLGPLNNHHALVLDELTPDNLIENITSINKLINETNLLDKTIVIGKNHEQETRLLGKQPDENTIDLYKNKRSSVLSIDDENNQHRQV